MRSLEEVKEKLYQNEFSPTIEQARRYVAFDPGLRYLRDMQGKIIRNSRGNEDPIALQMRNIFFPDLTIRKAKTNFIKASNYGSSKVNELFFESFGEIVIPFNLPQIPEDTNLTSLLKNAQIMYDQARSNGGHEMVGKTGELKSEFSSMGKRRKYFDYSLIVDACNIVRSIGMGYNMLKILQSSEYTLHSTHHNKLVSWTKNAIANGEEVLKFEERRKEPISILSKMVCTGHNMGNIKDLSGVRLVVKDRTDVGDLLRSTKEKVRGPSRIEGFERTKDRDPEDSPYYDPRFDCDKFILRPSVLYHLEDSSHKQPNLEDFLTKQRIRLPVEIQVVTEDALKRMYEDPNQVPAHELYKYKKALTFWQIVNPWKIFGPVMAQNPDFLKTG